MDSIINEELSKKKALEQERGFIIGVIDRCHKHLEEKKGNPRVEKLALMVKKYAIQEYIGTIKDEEEILEAIMKEI